MSTQLLRWRQCSTGGAPRLFPRCITPPSLSSTITTSSTTVTRCESTNQNNASARSNMNTIATFSTKSKSKSKSSPTTLEEMKAAKEAAKAYRTKLYQSKVNRQSKQRTRRNPTIKEYHKTQFRSWYDAITSHQSYLDREARRTNLPWTIRTAVLVERLPTVTPDVPKWEEEYDAVRAELDLYGKKYPDELGVFDPLEHMQSGDTDGPRFPLTKEELYELLPEGYTPAPRVTEADKNGNLKTLERKLKTRLYLAIRPDESTGWTLPTVTLQGIANPHLPLESKSAKAKEEEAEEAEAVSETLLDAAKRAASTMAGSSLQLCCMSNAPLGVDVLRYDPERQKELQVFGEKIFYVKVQYEGGHVEEDGFLKTNCEDWAWLDRQEIVERVTREKGERAGLFFHYLL